MPELGATNCKAVQYTIEVQAKQAFEHVIYASASVPVLRTLLVFKKKKKSRLQLTSNRNLLGAFISHDYHVTNTGLNRTEKVSRFLPLPPTNLEERGPTTRIAALTVHSPKKDKRKTTQNDMTRFNAARLHG